jgi:phage shock protein E
MDLTLLLIIAGIFLLLWMVKQGGQISAQAAKAHLEHGALVIDVRSPGEFQSGHLARAINIPLDEVESGVPAKVKDKNQVLLLHCLSGTRSGMARRQLRNMGYRNVFNLGSLARARNILAG